MRSFILRYSALWFTQGDTEQETMFRLYFTVTNLLQIQVIIRLFTLLLQTICFQLLTDKSFFVAIGNNITPSVCE